MSGTTDVMTAAAGAAATTYALFQMPEEKVKALPKTVSLIESCESGAQSQPPDEAI